MELVCRIEVIKEGRVFVVKAHLPNSSTKEYRHQNFENVLTEMAIGLQDSIEE
ncbi:MAG: hypothetical protein U9R21_06055 [Candidatus Thermoplasmatota archaeon]|nr:hypothetical protein [Candidatus Thermoplasmatota archaeon]